MGSPIDAQALVTRLAEKRFIRSFANELTETLTERDAKLVEIERESTIRLQLLEESSRAASEFERLVSNLKSTLEVNGLAMAEYARRVESAESELMTYRERYEALASHAPFQSKGTSLDIYKPEDSVILAGTGWHSFELDGADSFRWAGQDVRLHVAQLTRAPYELALEIEPGPAVGNKPFDLVISESGTQVTRVKVFGRQTIKIDLGSGEPRVRMLSLEAANAAPSLPAPGDPRVLKFRIFKIDVTRSANDVVSLANGFKAAQGWYPLETYNGETFRWAGPEVSIEAPSGASVDAVALEVEPGPGVDFGPLKLKVVAGDVTNGEFVVKHRERIVIPWPKNFNGNPLKLRVEGGGKMISTDPRVMNFRAFALPD